LSVRSTASYEGRPFLALEWVEGGSLANRLDGKPWPAGATAALIETLARAIDVAHAEGVVHRDLKPANILIQASGGRSQESGKRGRSAAGATAGNRPGQSALKGQHLHLQDLALVLACDDRDLHTIDAAYHPSPSPNASSAAGPHGLGAEAR
jgi:serine/threonine protein kinase